ncbi:MAG: ribulokinase [Chitinophagaceae bacterium]|nr:MAG: ribulokinase [Chitinophagaceae bacterium]
MSSQYVIGVDFGTDSVRTIIADTADGREIASATFIYPRWKKNLYCDEDRNMFRQHPLDYAEGLEATVTACLAKAGPAVASSVRALSVDTTGSTPCFVNREGTPLAMLPGFEENPNAMFILWKDHTSVKEATEINDYAAGQPVNYLKYVGGIYSSEWFWAKMLHTLRVDEAVAKEAWSMVEHCDWIPYLLTGGNDVMKLKRSVCAAGHKALWSPEFGGLPPDDFFAGIDPLLKGRAAQLFSDTYPSSCPAGVISPEWASRLGLPADVVIGVGAFDAHMGAVGGQIEPYHLCKIMGTSTCDILVVPEAEASSTPVTGICGQVMGSVIPGMLGMEAGQSAFGDSYAWFSRLLMEPFTELMNKSSVAGQDLAAQLLDEMQSALLPMLSQKASLLPFDETSEISVDWLNGRRTPDANQLLKSALLGLNLGTDAARLFRAIAESTCFGARSISDRFISQGIPVKGLIGMGGVAKKSPFIMQMMANVLNMPLRIHASEQTCALGAAMFAATAAGIFPDVQTAMQAMGQGFETEYHPDPAMVPLYEKRYQRFLHLGQYIEAETMASQAALNKN